MWNPYFSHQKLKFSALFTLSKIHHLSFLPTTSPGALLTFSKYFGSISQLSSSNSIELPQSAEVIIIGGGSAGCHTFYHLAKKGVKAVLLERAKLTAGTTWHTAGLIWHLRPNDIDIELLNNSRKMLLELNEESDSDAGWIQNGGIFLAHSESRLDEYKRLSSIGHALSIENYILDPKETQSLFPLLNPKSFCGSLYSPGDGVVDPAMLCSTLTKIATHKYDGQVIENCPVINLLLDENKSIKGVRTLYGDIRCDTVINATGVWGRDLIAKYDSHLPIIPMKHAYIVTESLNPSVRGLPNIRDHDLSLYFRIQGDSICIGGYEPKPILLETIPKDFNFSLYDLDWSIFEVHLNGALEICPKLSKIGVKSTICGPESFTPDHKPLMGPDPIIRGLFHNCGFNSAGMMFGGGCGEQLAIWLIEGKPSLPMFSFDVRRFTPKQMKSLKWIKEKSHESYVKNYSMVFKHDQPLAGRNFQIDALHSEMIKSNAFMEEKQGWERPGFFLKEINKSTKVFPYIIKNYDWYGSYGHSPHQKHEYEKILEGDLTYRNYSQHHNLIGEEALTCRHNAVIFNLSYFCKLLLEGPDATKAANWLFSGKIPQNKNENNNKIIYTCFLNNNGGVEADLTLSQFYDRLTDNKINNINHGSYYLVSGGASGYYTYSSLLAEIQRQQFQVNLRDLTTDWCIFSIQGPNARNILNKLFDQELDDKILPPQAHKFLFCENLCVKVMRLSFVGELGYELHIPNAHAVEIYQKLIQINKDNNFELRNAGYRALYSLSSEKGYHLWNYDLRPDDTPLEAGIEFTCRKRLNSAYSCNTYQGQEYIEKQRSEGIRKRMIYLLLEENNPPIWGLEGIYRNGEPVGFLRRAEYAYFLRKSIGQMYLEMPSSEISYISEGQYEIDVRGERIKAECYLKSPFDPQGFRIRGIYE